MSTTFDEIEVVEGLVVPTSADLRLSESVQVEEGSVQPDGSVLLQLIRPCVGKGRGRHLYPGEMLEANADKFVGWKMYLNHLSEAARRALGGLPRDVRDVGGIVDKSWWDGSVPAAGRFGQGAIIGRVKPISLIRDLIDLDPRLVECSINATATGVKRGKVGNDEVWVVEGISNEPPGSVDWVTEAGAGGQVASLMEAVYSKEDPVESFLDSLSYDELIEYMNDQRPDLAEAVAKRKPKPASGDDGDTEDKGDGGADDAAEETAEFASLVKKFTDKGMPKPAAEAAARRTMKAKKSTEGSHQVPELTSEEIREALSSDEGQEAIALAVRSELQALNLGERVERIVESRLDDERDANRIESEARANRRAEIAELREAAHSRIDGSKLTPLLKESLKRRFDIVEGAPTPELNLVADVDSAGSVTKSARAKLEESLDTCVKESFAILAEAAPTRVRGQGPTALTEGASDEKPEPQLDKDGKPIPPSVESQLGPVTAQLLRESGIKDPVAALKITPESVLAHQGVEGIGD